MSSMYCPHCGKLIEEGDIYCRHCGTKISYPGEEEPPKSFEEDPIDQTFSHLKEMQRQSILHKERMMAAKAKQRQHDQETAQQTAQQGGIVLIVFAIYLTIILVVTEIYIH